VRRKSWLVRGPSEGARARRKSRLVRGPSEGGSGEAEVAARPKPFAGGPGRGGIFPVRPRPPWAGLRAGPFVWAVAVEFMALVLFLPSFCICLVFRSPTVAPEPPKEWVHSFGGLEFEGVVSFFSGCLDLFDGCARAHPLGVAPEASEELYGRPRALLFVRRALFRSGGLGRVGSVSFRLCFLRFIF
jgi:hypothetical protein